MPRRTRCRRPTATSASRVARRVGRLILWAWIGVFLLCGTVFIVEGLVSHVDPSHRCGAGETSGCFSRREHGVVTGSSGHVVVAYDDGRRSFDFHERGFDTPSRGTRVLIERCDGKVVAIVDRATERRYRSTDWPDPAGGDGLFALGLGLGPLLVVVARRFLRRA